MVLSEYNLAGDALLCRFCSSFESAVSVEVAYVWTEDVSIERTSITALVLAVLIFVVFLIAGSKIRKIDEKNTLYCIYCNLYNCRDILDCECFNGIAHGCVQCT